jgi:hypothetical protein
MEVILNNTNLQKLTQHTHTADIMQSFLDNGCMQEEVSQFKALIIICWLSMMQVLQLLACLMRNDGKTKEKQCPKKKFCIPHRD